MCISARDDSLPWPMHALLYVCSRFKEPAPLSHSRQLVAGIVAHLEERIYIWKEIIIALLRSFGCCIWPVFLRF